MTNTLRAYKLNKLASIVKDTDHIGSNDNNWTLRWPPPRDRQTAEIDINSGKIISYKRADGLQTIDCDPINWVSVIDRRIDYLWRKFKDELTNKEVAS